MIPLHCFKYDNPIIDTINKLIKILYEDLDNPAGGPLHIITDDENYRDHDLDFCEKQCYENSNGYYNEATIHVSLAIINLLRQINGEERYCTYYPEVYNNCNGDCEKYVIELEDKEFCD